MLKPAISITALCSSPWGRACIPSQSCASGLAWVGSPRAAQPRGRCQGQARQSHRGARPQHAARQRGKSTGRGGASGLTLGVFLHRGRGPDGPRRERLAEAEAPGMRWAGRRGFRAEKDPTVGPGLCCKQTFQTRLPWMVGAQPRNPPLGRSARRGLPAWPALQPHASRAGNSVRPAAAPQALAPPKWSLATSLNSEKDWDF